MQDGQASCFLTVDQGTSGTKALLFDRSGTLISRCDKGHNQFYPHPGWVEHDPDEIYSNMIELMKTVMSSQGITSEQIICFSLSNQRETTLIWDKRDGRPVTNAVVWQCNRAEDICKRIGQQGYGPMVKQKTGLVLSPYFSAAKASWIVENCITDDLENYMFGTMDSYLIWRLTAGEIHVTDHSNASRTQLFDIKELKWDEKLLHLFGLEGLNMPQVCESDTPLGKTAPGLFPTRIPIGGVLGDSHAAFFGQCCTKKGRAKATYGTGSSVMMNIGSEPGTPTETVVTSIGFSLKDQIVYVAEGNINCTGATIKWLVDDLELIESSKDAGPIASSVDDTQGVYFVPAFVGLSAPYWNSDVRACIKNMTRGTKKAHIVRAAEESIAYQITDVIKAMEEETGINLEELRVDGGPTRDDFLMQFQADILDAEVTRNTIEELSATGAMYMGGLAFGVWDSLEQIEALRSIEKTFSPSMTHERREKNYQGWKSAVEELIASGSYRHDV